MNEDDFETVAASAQTFKIGAHEVTLLGPCYMRVEIAVPWHEHQPMNDIMKNWADIQLARLVKYMRREGIIPDHVVNENLGIMASLKHL